MLRLVLTALFVACVAPAFAMSLAANYEPIGRSEFVSGLLAVGLRQVSATELETPEGYRLDLGSAYDFRVLRAWLAHGAFNGTFCSEKQAYHVTTLHDPDEATMSRTRYLILQNKFTLTVAFERIGNLVLQVSRDLPPVPERVVGPQPCTP